MAEWTKGEHGYFTGSVSSGGGGARQTAARKSLDRWKHTLKGDIVAWHGTARERARKDDKPSAGKAYVTLSLKKALALAEHSTKSWSSETVVTRLTIPLQQFAKLKKEFDSHSVLSTPKVKDAWVSAVLIDGKRTSISNAIIKARVAQRG